MIHTVRFRNFKALRDLELNLDRFTLLVGPNASGKTSVLDGLHALTRLASTDPRFVFEGRLGVGVVATRGAQGAMELGLTGTFRRKRGDLAITFSAIEDYPFTDAYRFESRWGDRRFTLRRELNPPEDAPETHPGGELGLGLVLRDAAKLRFDLDRLAEPSYSDLATPLVSGDGSGLAAVIAEMAAGRPDDFARLQEALRAVIPGLTRVRLVRVKVPRRGDTEGVWGHEVVFDMAGAADIPARAASEGMLRALGLFATLLAEGHPNLVLIDQIERAITPSSLGALGEQIQAILELDPDLQIVATTDSPAFVDHQEAECVRVHCLLEDGSVRVRPLVEHPEYELLRVDLRPGEFWSQVGDAWVADDREDDDAAVDRETLMPPTVGPLSAAVEGPMPDSVVIPDDVLSPESAQFPPSMPPLPNGPGRS